MRARKKKNTKERLSGLSEIVLNYKEFFNADWEEIFKNKNPLHLEIGCGKGAFITKNAALSPDINFVAIEKIPDVLVIAAETAAEQKTGNVRFCNADAQFLNYAFKENSLDCIYINFCDPWLKKSSINAALHTKAFLIYTALC